MYDIEDTPQPAPIEQPTHAFKRRMRRRLFLGRVLPAGVFSLIAGLGGVAGTATTLHAREQEALQTTRREDAHTQDSAVQAAYAQGRAAGHAQGVRDFAARLATLGGVTPEQASTSSKILQALYAVFIVPVGESAVGTVDMLQSLALARRFIVAAGDDTSAIDALSTILQSWQANAGGLVKPLSQTNKGDSTTAATYLAALESALNNAKGERA